MMMNKFVKYVYLDMFYVLDYSGSFDMHIEKSFLKKCQKSANTGGGGSERY